MPVRYVQPPVNQQPMRSLEQAYTDMLGFLTIVFSLWIFGSIGVGVLLFGYSTLVVVASTAVGAVPAIWFMAPVLKTLLKHRPGRDKKH